MINIQQKNSIIYFTAILNTMGDSYLNFILTQAEDLDDSAVHLLRTTHITVACLLKEGNESENASSMVQFTMHALKQKFWKLLKEVAMQLSRRISANLEK